MLQYDSTADVPVMMTSLAASDVSTGTVSHYAGSSAPAGWLLLYGQAVSRTTYATLFAVIGTTYGAGDGSTTFNLPDCRGRGAIGLDNMGGSPANRVTSAGNGVNSTQLGGTGGDQLLQQHAHGVNDPSHHHAPTSGQGTPSGNLVSGAVGALPYQITTNQDNVGFGDMQYAAMGISIQNAGSGGARNMPPVISFNMNIKS